MTYRNDAQRALNRAKTELESQSDERLKYAALELRMAMESLTYDRAVAYKDEFPESEYETWQPKKVMQVLLEIDPAADKDCSFAFGEEPALGEEPVEMHSLGTETVLNMSTIKAHYDALGSFLHVQTLKQRKSGKQLDFPKIRARCDEIATGIDKALASPVWNLTPGHFTTFDCDCGAKVRRRLPLDGGPTVAECECGAKFDVEQMADGGVHSRLQQTQITCPKAECATDAWLPRHVIRPGLWWKCAGCGAHIKVQIGLAVEEPAESNVD